LKQYQTALEAFANTNNGLYPNRSPAVDLTTLCSSGVLNPPLKDFIPSCPQDPRLNAADGYQYKYLSDPSTTANGATKYVVYDKLESKDSYFEICSNGVSGYCSGTCSVGLDCTGAVSQ